MAWRKAVCFLALVAAMYGCKGESAETPSAEISSGGESFDSGEAPSVAAGTSEPPSPWGATQAEQCKHPDPPPIASKAQRDVARGLQAAASGDDAGAKREFESALSRDSNAYTAIYNLGVLADRSGDEAGALREYRRALGIVPDYAPAARGIATISLRRGRAQEALAVVEPIANQYRTNLEILALYAELLVEVRRFDEAWMAARRALKCDERFVPALIALIKASQAQGRDELADSILEQALEVDPEAAELHFLEGERLKAEPGRLRDAMAAYEKAIQLRPDYAEARMALGIQLLAGGNYQGALDQFQATEKLVPTLPAVYVNLGDAYRATEQWTAAETAYRKAISLQSKLPEAHYGLGLLFLTSAGEFPGLDELSAYEKAVEEFKTYRSEMGARLSKSDQSAEYLRDLDRLIQRTRRRLEREEGGSS